MKKLFASITVLVFGLSTFVSAQSFTTVHEWMFDNGLTTMTEENFRPQDYITRGEVAKNFSQMAKVLNLTKSKTAAECAFNDIEGYDYTLVPHIVEACEYGLVKGSQGSYFPNNQISQAELITVTVRMLMGFQDETTTPWWKNYHEMGQWLGILDNEGVWDLDTPAKRQTVGTWLYRATNVDTSAAQDEGTDELKSILEEIFGEDFFEE